MGSCKTGSQLCRLCNRALTSTLLHPVVPEMLFFRAGTKQRKNFCDANLGGFFQKPFKPDRVFHQRNTNGLFFSCGATVCCIPVMDNAAFFFMWDLCNTAFSKLPFPSVRCRAAPAFPMRSTLTACRELSSSSSPFRAAGFNVFNIKKRKAH